MTVEKKIEELKQELQKFFPNLESFSGMAGRQENGKDNFGFGVINIPNENKNLQGSTYWYDKDSAVHFTCIEALKSIIKSCHLRMFNLTNLNDPTEFIYAANVFDVGESVVNDAKHNLYTFSFCEPEIMAVKNQKNQFNLWRLYGRNGQGCAIEFEITNDPLEWDGFHFSDMVYGEKKQFKDLINLKNKVVIHSNISVDLGKLFPFHKNDLFEIEREVRIVFDDRAERSGSQNKREMYPDDSYFPVIMNKDTEKETVRHEKKVKYLNLPLYSEVKNFQQLNTELAHTKPVLKINKVTIGYVYSDQEYEKHKSDIEQISIESLGYKPKIEQSFFKDMGFQRKQGLHD